MVSPFFNYKNMKVKVLSNAKPVVLNRMIYKDEVIEVEEKHAKELIRIGLVKELKDPKETKELKVKIETK